MLDVLPRIGAALAVLIIGLFLARVLAKFLAKIMLKAKIDQMGEKVGIGASLNRVGLGRSVTKIVVTIIRIFISLFVIVLAVGLLGVQTLEEPVNEFILLLPRLLVAVAIIFLGIFIAGYVSDWVDRLTEQMGIKGPLGALAGALVIAIFVIVGAAQAGIPTSIFIVLMAIVLGAGALTFAFSFGFGSQTVARQITAGRYLGDDLEVGQTIQVAEVEGRITRFESAYIVLEGPSGEMIRVPNSAVLDSVVRVTGEGPQDAASPY